MCESGGNAADSPVAFFVQNLQLTYALIPINVVEAPHERRSSALVQGRHCWGLCCGQDRACQAVFPQHIRATFIRIDWDWLHDWGLLRGEGSHTRRR